MRPVAGLVDGVVVALVRQGGGTLKKIYQQDAPTRERNFARMQQVLARIEREVSGARRSA